MNESPCSLIELQGLLFKILHPILKVATLINSETSSQSLPSLS